MLMVSGIVSVKGRAGGPTVSLGEIAARLKPTSRHRAGRTPGLSAEPVAQGASIEALPVFTLAQDQGVLLLDVAVKLSPRTGAERVDATVRVVSSPHDAADALAHWSADDARRLKASAAAMFGHALLLAARHAVPAAPEAASAPMRTHRYRQGLLERSERGQQVDALCARVVLRNLRGWLMSVPQRVPDDAPCTADAAF